MKYFYVEPEVAGGLGKKTIINRAVSPFTVERLNYQMEGWLGDAILESFPVFIVTEQAKKILVQEGVTGAVFDNVEVTTEEQFGELYPDSKLPKFSWLKPVGQAGRDDVGAAADGRLVLSQRALNALNRLGISHALLEPFQHDGE